MNRRRRGMSFFEISIVVLIVGILAAIGTPHFAASTRAQNARNASVRIADYVHYIREVAINEGRSTSFVVDANGDHFYSTDVSFPDRIGEPIWVDVKSTFDNSIEITGSFDGQATLGFDLEGVPNLSGAPLVDGVIQIQSIDVTYEIAVDGGTGSTTIGLVDNGEELDEESEPGEVDGSSGATT